MVILKMMLKIRESATSSALKIGLTFILYVGNIGIDTYICMAENIQYRIFCDMSQYVHRLFFTISTMLRLILPILELVQYCHPMILGDSQRWYAPKPYTGKIRRWYALFSVYTGKICVLSTDLLSVQSWWIPGTYLSPQGGRVHCPGGTS